MKKNQKKGANLEKGVLSKLNDNSGQNEKVGPPDKKKGIISKLNDDPDQKE